jgi:SAM-dependent methyltransferase
MSSTKKPAKQRGFSRSTHCVDPVTLRAAMARRLLKRAAVSGRITVPAVPGMTDECVDMCRRVFAGLGRAMGSEELAQCRTIIGDKLAEAYGGSPRSNIVIEFGAPPKSLLRYEVAADVRTIADAYASWVAERTPPLFGTHPDARITTLAQELTPPESSPVLDIGAGTGRNALALARLGHPVDALEMTPKFAELLEEEAAEAQLAVRVIRKNLFESQAELGRNYRLILLSEVLADFHDTAELRRLFEIASDALTVGGILVFNVHVPMAGFAPDTATLQWAQSCYSMYFTSEQLSRAIAGLPLEMVADDSVHDFERTHLPEEAWPPTGWYAEWVTGQDLYDVPREQSPIEMRWLVYKKI